MTDNAKNTQCSRLLEYLQRYGSITAIDALTELGIFRLAARIHDLREQGHVITSRMVKVLNRFSEACSVAEYRIEGSLQ